MFVWFVLNLLSYSTIHQYILIGSKLFGFAFFNAVKIKYANWAYRHRTLFRSTMLWTQRSIGFCHQKKYVDKPSIIKTNIVNSVQDMIKHVNSDDRDVLWGFFSGRGDYKIEVTLYLSTSFFCHCQNRSYDRRH